jgi:hypothetical protein
MFEGPLKWISEPEQILYLLLWAGDWGREIHTTHKDMSEEDAKITWQISLSAQGACKT